MVSLTNRGQDDNLGVDVGRSSTMATAWVDQFFTSSRQARTGGIVRRSVANVERLDALDEIISEARRRGFHVLETGGQIVLLAHEGSVILHC